LSPAAVADRLQAIAPQLRLTMLSNRGTQVWPTGSNFTDCVNHYRARFENATPADQATIVATIGAVAEHFALCGAEVLREIDGEPGFSLAQGQA
jgi:isocitrate dehydrogenase